MRRTVSVGVAAVAVLLSLAVTAGVASAADCDPNAKRDANGALHNSLTGQYCKATPANANATSYPPKAVKPPAGS